MLAISHQSANAHLIFPLDCNFSIHLLNTAVYAALSMTADVKEISTLTNVTRCDHDNRNAVVTQHCMFILVSLGKNKETMRAFDEV